MAPGGGRDGPGARDGLVDEERVMRGIKIASWLLVLAGCVSDLPPAAPPLDASAALPDRPVAAEEIDGAATGDDLGGLDGLPPFDAATALDAGLDALPDAQPDAAQPDAAQPDAALDAEPPDAEPADVCEPAPEICNGRDDDCSGVIDDQAACGPWVQAHCRAWLGWSDRPREAYQPVDRWGECPGADTDRLGRSRCTSTRGEGLFRYLWCPGDLAAGHFLAVAFTCDHPDAGLAGWIETHCAIYLGYADVDRGPDGVQAWGPCPAEAAGSGPGGLSCTSSGGDRQWRPLPLEGDVDNNDDLAVAFICGADPAQPGRAAAVAASVQVFLGWSRYLDAIDRGAWGDCPGADDREGNTRCVGSGGDARFHRLDLGDQDWVDLGDTFAVALRARQAGD